VLVFVDKQEHADEVSPSPPPHPIEGPIVWLAPPILTRDSGLRGLIQKPQF